MCAVCLHPSPRRDQIVETLALPHSSLQLLALDKLSQNRRSRVLWELMTWRARSGRTMLVSGAPPLTFKCKQTRDRHVHCTSLVR